MMISNMQQAKNWTVGVQETNKKI